MKRRNLALTLSALTAFGIALAPAVVTASTDAASAATTTCYGQTFGPGYKTTKHCVEDIQDLLNIYGDGPYQLTVDGVYGAQTRNDVANFQDAQWVGLTADGIVGPKTWKYLCQVDRGTDGPEVDAGCPVG